MPDETLIAEIESILNQVVELGAATERTRLAPNLLVRNDSPGPAGFILVRDDRDGDNILARKVPGVVYNTNDLVNVLFIRGGEAIAFQQGSGSTSSDIWGIIDGTSTDIFYNSGDVSIGKATVPDARLELLDTAQSQLRLTFQDATKYADFTVDTSHDLTVDPSSTGEIILNADVRFPADSQAYILGGRGSSIYFQGQTAATVSTLELFSSDGDGTDNVNLTIFGKGTPIDITNRERLLVSYRSTGEFLLQSEADGTGTLRPIIVETEGNTDQVKIDTNGDVIVNGDFILSSGSQDYTFSDRSTNLTLQGQTGGVATSLEFFSADGDGTDITGFNVFGVGTPGAVTNRERLQIRYNSTQLFEIFTEANGTGVLRSLDIYTEGNSNQIRLATDGNVGLGVASPSTQLDIGAGAIEFEEMTTPVAGAANTGRLFIRDDGGSDTELCFRASAGLVQVVAPLHFAGISVEDNGTATTISTINTPVQVTVFDTNEASNGATPDHTNDHITINKAGTYYVSFFAAISSVAGAAAKFHIEAYKNNGVTHLSGIHTARNLAGGGGDTGSISGGGLIDLSDGDTVELWVENNSNTQNIVFEDISLSVQMVGVSS